MYFQAMCCFRDSIHGELCAANQKANNKKMGLVESVPSIEDEYYAATKFGEKIPVVLTEEEKQRQKELEAHMLSKLDFYGKNEKKKKATIYEARFHHSVCVAWV